MLQVGTHSNNGRHDFILQGWSAHEPDAHTSELMHDTYAYQWCMFLADYA